MKKKKFILMAIVSVTAIAASGCGGGSSSEKETTSIVETTTVKATESTTEESTTQEETTKETTSENSKSEAALSDDIYSFQLQLDGDVYQFPMKYEDFVAKGWVYDGDENKMLDAGYKAGTQVFDKGKLEVYADIINFDINARPLNECYIGGISVDQWQLGKTEARAVLAKGIELGVSGADEIRSAYGTPSYDSSTDSGMVTIEYSMDSYQMVRMVVDSESKKINRIQIQNYLLPENFESGEISTAVPEIVGKYQIPEGMSEEFADFIVNFDNSIYRLPAPVSTFEENGWAVVEEKTDLQVSGRDFGWVTLMKDNQILKVMANNYSDQATSIHNCFVTSVQSDDSSIKIPLTIAKGISIGMAQAELETALSGTDYEKDDSSSNYTYYEIAPGKSTLDRYEIYVKKESGKVYRIEVKFSPKYDTYTN